VCDPRQARPIHIQKPGIHATSPLGLRVRAVSDLANSPAPGLSTIAKYTRAITFHATVVGDRRLRAGRWSSPRPLVRSRPSAAPGPR